MPDKHAMPYDRSLAARARWQNPEYRARTLAALSAPEVVAKKVASLRAAKAETSNETRMRLSEAARRRWNKLSYRRNRVGIARQLTDEERERARQQCLVTMQTPDVRERRQQSCAQAMVRRAKRQLAILTTLEAEIGLTRDCRDIGLLRRVLDQGVYRDHLARYLSIPTTTLRDWIKCGCKPRARRLALALGTLASLVQLAYAAPPPPGTEDYDVLMPYASEIANAHEDDYKEWRCCDIADGTLVDVKTVGNVYFVSPRVDRIPYAHPGTWYEVRPETVLHKWRNPTGEPIAWFFNGTVRCFAPPIGG